MKQSITWQLIASAFLNFALLNGMNEKNIVEHDYQKIFHAWNIQNNHDERLNFCYLFRIFNLKLNNANRDEQTIITIKNQCKNLFSLAQKRSSTTTFLLFLPNFFKHKNNELYSFEEFLPSMITKENIESVRLIKNFFNWSLLYPQLMNSLIYTYNMSIKRNNLFFDINNQLKCNYREKSIYTQSLDAEANYIKIFFDPKPLSIQDTKHMKNCYLTTLACLKVTKAQSKIPKWLLHATIFPRMLFVDMQRSINNWIKEWKGQKGSFAYEFISQELSNWYFERLQHYFKTFFLSSKK